MPLWYICTINILTRTVNLSRKFEAHKANFGQNENKKIGSVKLFFFFCTIVTIESIHIESKSFFFVIASKILLKRKKDI